VVSYHLGPVDPDRRTELFADPRDGDPRRRPRGVLATLLTLLVMGLFSGGLWLAYVEKTRRAGGDAANGAVPLIRADERPTKVKPEQPGGMQIPDRDKLIYNQMRPVVEHLLPLPEKPMARPAAPPPSPPLQTDTARSPAGTPPPASAAPEKPQAATQTAQPPQPAGKAAPAAPAPSKSPAAKTGGTRLQLGSVRSEDAARQEWERIKRKNPDLLGNISATPIRADLGDRGVYYRIQTAPFTDLTAAERICSELKQRSIGCIIAR